MKKTWQLFVLVFVLALPRLSVAQNPETEAGIRIIGAGVGLIDREIQKRKAEKEAERKQREESLKQYMKAQEELKVIEASKALRMADMLMEEDNDYKEKVSEGIIPYGQYYGDRYLCYWRNINRTNTVTYYSSSGEAIILELGFDQLGYLCLRVRGENNNVIANGQTIKLSVRMEFYGGWPGDDYRFMYDNCSIVIPSNTYIYEEWFSRVFPKYFDRLRSYEMTNDHDLKRNQLDRVSVKIQSANITAGTGY